LVAASTKKGGASDNGSRSHYLNDLRKVAARETAGHPALILVDQLLASIIHHAANDGIEFVLGEGIYESVHVHLLLFDDGTIHIVFGRLSAGLITRCDVHHSAAPRQMN
jgi:hypothetical protein